MTFFGGRQSYIEEYGKKNSRIIVMLHGAYFVHALGRQYSLANQYHLIVFYIMGFGNNTKHIFETDLCIKELTGYIKSLDEKVILVDFSLGAQLAFRLVSEHEELFDSAIIVSSWLIKVKSLLSEIEHANIKQPRSLQIYL